MKIALVQLGRIGDMVLLTPLLRAIRAQYPNAIIDVIAGRKNAAIVQGHPLVQHVHVFDKHPLVLLKLAMAMRREHYDWWVDPKDHFSRESGMLAWLAGARSSVGYNRAGKKVFTFGVANSEENYRLHAVERGLRALAPLGIPQPPCLLDSEEQCADRANPFAAESAQKPDAAACREFDAALDVVRPYLVAGAEETRYVRDVVGACSRPLVVVNISASHVSRMWPHDKWAAIVQRVAEHCDVVLSCQPSEADVARAIVSLVPQVRLFPSRSIGDVIALVQRARAVLTPDTAVVHIAAACNTPVVVLYPRIHANYLKFRPLSSCAVAVVPPEGKQEVEYIDTSAVWEAWQAVAERVGLPRTSSST